jgi:hypothetical protein
MYIWVVVTTLSNFFFIETTSKANLSYFSKYVTGANYMCCNTAVSAQNLEISPQKIRGDKMDIFGENLVLQFNSNF